MLFSEPTPLANLTLIARTTSNLTIGWSFESVNPGAYDGVVVTYTSGAGSGGPYSFGPHIVSETLDGLDAGYAYTISVATTSAGVTSSHPLTITEYTSRQL